jgi:hypothetical protein
LEQIQRDPKPLRGAQRGDVFHHVNSIPVSSRSPPARPIEEIPHPRPWISIEPALSEGVIKRRRHTAYR